MGWSLTVRSRWSHRFSIGLRSGEFAGQGIRATLCPWSQFRVTRVRCGGALSCWKRRPWFGRLLFEWKTWGLGFDFCTCVTRTCHVAVSDFSTQLTSVSIPNRQHCESAVGYCAFCFVNFFPLCIFVTFFLRLKILKSQPFVYFSSHNKNKNMVLLEKDWNV